MHKRTFLTSLLAASSAPVWSQPRPGKPAGTPVLLTVTGAVGKTNRAAFDPSRDVLMAHHKIAFTSAYAIDWGMLATLPSRSIEPTVEYDAKRHRLSGPALVDVLKLANVRATDSAMLTLRAIDGYAPTVMMADARRDGFIVATHIDGVPLHVGGLGPLWALFDADRLPEYAARPLAQRFARCPWGLYHVDVQPGT